MASTTPSLDDRFNGFMSGVQSLAAVASEGLTSTMVSLQQQAAGTATTVQQQAAVTSSSAAAAVAASAVARQPKGGSGGGTLLGSKTAKVIITVALLGPSLNVFAHTYMNYMAKRKAAAEAAAANSPTAAATTAPTAAEVSPPRKPLMLPEKPAFNDEDFIGWEVVSLLGRGAFGAAYKARLRDGRIVCAKVIELGEINATEGMAKLHNEINLMKRLNHPNIVQYYGSNTDMEKRTINIFMECVEGGTLTSFAKAFASSSAPSSPKESPVSSMKCDDSPQSAIARNIPPSILRDWCRQIVRGAAYLHDSNIVHRDIKCDNILVSGNGVLKLADFGCSKSLDDVCSQTFGCKTMAGTPYWMAPEVITSASGGGPDGQTGYGPKSDVWSIGCTIIEAITGKPAWPECKSMWAAIYKIANSTGLPAFFDDNPDADPQLRAFLERMFERSVAARAGTKELLDHPYLGTASAVKRR